MQQQRRRQPRSSCSGGSSDRRTASTAAAHKLLLVLAVLLSGRSSSGSSSISCSSAGAGDGGSGDARCSATAGGGGSVGGVAAAAPSPTVEELLMAPTRDTIDGTEVIWAGPAQPRGLLLAFHGCSHGAVDWWPRSEACPQCIGLAEEVAISRAALARGWALAAFSSRDREFRRCWAVPHSPATHSVDSRAVAAVLPRVAERAGWGGVPAYALGASSGGAFVLTLGAFVPLAGVAAQIMGLPGAWYEGFLDAPPAGGGAQPPAMFVHMGTRDRHTAADVGVNVASRRARRLSSRVINVSPQPVTAELLAARVADIPNIDAARKIVAALAAAGVADPATGLLREDPRQSRWRDAVRASGAAGAGEMPLGADASGLSEVLNVCWAAHELVGGATEAMLDWFEAGGPDAPGVEELAPGVGGGQAGGGGGGGGGGDEADDDNWD